MCARKTALSGALNCAESEQPDSAVGLIRDCTHYDLNIHASLPEPREINGRIRTRRDSPRVAVSRVHAA
jgi:hypothetical protein